MSNVLISIGRQVGSGGYRLGKRLSEELGIPFYDKELVKMVAEKHNISEEALKSADEKATGSLLYSVVTGSYSLHGLGGPLYYDMPINDKLFLAQSEVISEAADKSSCVVIGRCADYVMKRAEKKCLSVFMYAGIDFRVKNIAAEYDLTPSKAKDKIQKMEKQRRAYYDYYTNRQWGVMSNYDICINTEVIGEDMAFEIIKAAYLKMQKEG